MKRFETLPDLMTFIQTKHRKINSKQGGVQGYKMFRKPDGRRILFEEIKGFRIFRFQAVDDRTLTIDTLATGFAFRNNEKITVSSRLFLPDLAVINVYDHRAEFFSSSSIDFAYIEDDKVVELQMLEEYINDDPGIVRAQWLAKDDDVDRILDEVTGGRKAKPQLSTENPRFLHLGLKGS